MNHDTHPNHPQVLDDEQKRACQLGLWGLLPLWHELDPALRARMCDAQTAERHARSLARRTLSSRIGTFKPSHDFDWSWPEQIDRQVIEELQTGGFLAQAVNPIFVGPTGTGKSMLAKNIAHGALLRGRTVRMVTVADMLADLARNAVGESRSRALRRYISPALLVLDDLGQTAYDNSQADALFTVIAARHLRRSTMITTQASFGQWHQVFPNAACVHKLIDLLTHVSEVIEIKGESFRLREATERKARLDVERAKSRTAAGPR